VRVPALRGRLPDGSGPLLVPAAAFGVHQLRYWLAYGGRANAELAAQGHSYLHSLAPWVVLALGVGLALFLRRAAGAARTGDAGRFTRLSAVALWAFTWGGLVCLYVVQESLEQLVASGHPTGAGGIVGHGGWWAIPVAAVIAAGVVLTLRAARSLLRTIVRLRGGPGRLHAPLVAGPLAFVLARARPLASAAAGRAPPASLPAR
jgi:hypothetical protein